MAITKCTISATLHDLVDAVPGSLQAYLMCKAGAPFFHGTTLIPAFTIKSNFNAVTGIVSLQVIETTTPGKRLEFSIVLTDGIRQKVIRLNPAIVPNAATANLAEITQVDQNSTY